LKFEFKSLNLKRILIFKFKHSVTGVNSTGEVKPQVDVHSIQVFGTYDNFSISWSLANTLPPTVAVYYTVTVRSTINSSTYYEVC